MAQHTTTSAIEVAMHAREGATATGYVADVGAGAYALLKLEDSVIAFKVFVDDAELLARVGHQALQLAHDLRAAQVKARPALV